MSHGDRKDGCGDCRHGGGGRGAGGRARQSRHAGHRARARSAPDHGGLQAARRIALLPAPGPAPQSQAPAGHLAAQCKGPRQSAAQPQLRQPGGRRHRPLRRGLVALSRGRLPRPREHPLPPLATDQSGVLFDEAASKLGYHPFSPPHAIISQDYRGRQACTYCGFCQAFGCHVGAKSSTLVTLLPLADASGNFTLVTGAMCHRVNSDNSGRATGVSYYGPDGSDNTIEAVLVILTTFIYDNTRLLLLSKTDKFPNGLANSSGQLGKHVMAHIMAKVFVGFDDRFVNIYMGPSAQKHTID